MLDSGHPVDHAVVQSYFRQCFFISLVRRIERSRRKVVRDGNAPAVFAYLQAYISGAIVSRSSLRAEREIDVVTLALQPAVFVPCRADVAGNRHFRIARRSRDIYLQFSLAGSRNVSLA